MVGYSLSVVGYIMHLIQVDGGGTVSNGQNASSIGVIYPGERIDIIIEPMSQLNRKNASIRVKLDDEYGSVKSCVRNYTNLILEI